MRRSLSSLLLATAIGLGACETDWPPPGTPMFQEGWAAGCDSGYADAGRDGQDLAYRRGAEYERDKEYQSGWHDGYDYCFEDEQKRPRLLPGLAL